jgi:hypothetical protein
MWSECNALLDRVLPLCEQYAGYALSLVNEPQFYFQDNAAVPVVGFVSFMKSARDHAHSLSDQVGAVIVWCH